MFGTVQLVTLRNLVESCSSEWMGTRAVTQRLRRHSSAWTHAREYVLCVGMPVCLLCVCFVRVLCA